MCGSELVRVGLKWCLILASLAVAPEFRVQFEHLRRKNVLILREVL
jgi:hypothetical protein